MTCGVVVPVDVDLMEEVVDTCGRWIGQTDSVKVPDDHRFAAAVYRCAIDAGIMESVEYAEPSAAA